MSTTSSPPATTAVATPDPTGLARRQIAIFLSTTFGLLAASTVTGVALDVDVRHLADASPTGQAAMYGQALWPLVGAVVAQLATRRTLRRPGWGFQRTPWRTLGLAWLFAVVVGVLPPVLVWVTGFAGFNPADLARHALLAMTVLALPYVVLALGEDVGWRGLLVSRLALLGGPRLVVLGSGLAWAAFHWPLMLFLGGAPEGVPLLWSVPMFTIATTALGAVLAWMRLRWGQWPGVVAHAVLNAVTYHLIVPATVEDTRTGWVGTESGLAAALVLTVAAVLWLRSAPLRRVDGRTVAALGTRPGAPAPRGTGSQAF
jgi:membrane protease YdiL (CAAX protease family)